MPLESNMLEKAIHVKAVPTEELEHSLIIPEGYPADLAPPLILQRQEEEVDKLIRSSIGVVLILEGLLVLMVIAVEVPQQRWHPLAVLLRLSPELFELVLIGFHHYFKVCDLLFELRNAFLAEILLLSHLVGLL